MIPRWLHAVAMANAMPSAAIVKAVTDLQLHTMTRYADDLFL